jgi:hypothetical protein
MGQDMHRNLGASVMGGVEIKTARNDGRGENIGTMIKPGVTVGLNFRLRLSQKSSLQVSGNLILDRYAIRDHLEWHSFYFTQGWPDTTYSERRRGDIELQQLYWQGALAYRYTINHRWGGLFGYSC